MKGSDVDGILLAKDSRIAIQCALKEFAEVGEEVGDAWDAGKALM